MASVIDLHIPDPPPVQNKTFPLKRSGLNTSIELAKGATICLEVIVSTRDMRSWLASSCVDRQAELAGLPC